MSIEHTAETPPLRNNVLPPTAELMNAWLATRTTENIVEALQDVLQNDYLAARHLVRVGLSTYRELHGHPVPADLYPATHFKLLDDQAWYDCINPAMPTIGFYADKGAGLLAAAAQDLRWRGESAPNIVILSNSAHGGHRHDDQAYYVERGVVVGSDYTVYFGQFPTPLRLDCHTALSDTRDVGDPPLPSYLNDLEFEGLLGDKSATSRELHNADIATIPTLCNDTTAQDPRLHQIVHYQMSRGQAIVIKPQDGFIGRSIIMADPAQHNPEDIIDKLRSHQNPNQHFIVQPWVRCPTLHLPETNVRVDWNIRALIIKGTPIGMYARLGRFGEPVNISRGADPHSLDQIFNYYNLLPQQRHTITDNIWRLCQQIGDNFPRAGKIGADIILDESWQPNVLELNGERAGGWYNIAKTSAASHGDTPLTLAVKALGKSMPTLRHRTTRQEVTTDPTVLLDCIWKYYSLDPATYPEETYFAAAALHHIYDELNDAERSLATPLLAHYGFVNDTLATISHYNMGEDDLAIRYLNETKRRLAAGDKDALALINSYVEADPSNLHRHFQAAANMHAICAQLYPNCLDSLTLPQQTEVNAAQAAGRMICMDMLDFLGISAISIHTETLRLLQEAFADYMMTPPQLRKLPPAAEIITDINEYKYLSKLFDYVNAYHHAIRGETSHLEKRLTRIRLSEPQLLKRLEDHLTAYAHTPPESLSCIGKARIHYLHYLYYGSDPVK